MLPLDRPIQRLQKEVSMKYIENKEYNPVLRLLALPLVAMAWAGPIRTVRSPYLPPSSIAFGDCKLVIGVTPADHPLFKDFSRAAIDLASDTILIRAGLSPEIDNPVTVDAAVRTPAELLIFRALHFMERENGDLEQAVAQPERVGETRVRGIHRVDHLATLRAVDLELGGLLTTRGHDLIGLLGHGASALRVVPHRQPPAPGEGGATLL